MFCAVLVSLDEELLQVGLRIWCFLQYRILPGRLKLVLNTQAPVSPTPQIPCAGSHPSFFFPWLQPGLRPWAAEDARCPPFWLEAQQLGQRGVLVNKWPFVRKVN